MRSDRVEPGQADLVLRLIAARILGLAGAHMRLSLLIVHILLMIWSSDQPLYNPRTQQQCSDVDVFNKSSRDFVKL